MMSSVPTPQTPGWVLRALLTLSAHTAESYRTVWSADTQRERPRGVLF